VTVSGGRFGRAAAVTARPRGGPAAASTALAGVSCRSPGNCTAAGVASNRSGQLVTAYAVWAKGRWSVAYLRQPANARRGKHRLSSLFAAACPARARCVVAGYYNNDAGGYAAEAATVPARRPLQPR
jgi:hypothetical protein